MTRTPLAASALAVAMTLTIPEPADLAARGSGQPAAAVHAFTNVNVVPMDRERVLERQDVIVRNGVIERVGPAGATKSPEGAVVVDGTGKWLMPGLAEMHAHVPGGKATDEAIQRVLELFVLNGVTTARGMLGDPRHLPLRERTHRAEILAPWLVTSGPSFNGNSAPTIDIATKMVEDQKAAGYDFLKIHPGVKRDVFDALAAAADRVGIRFAGHVPLDVGLARALELRFQTIDHVDGYVEALVREGAAEKPADSQWFGVNLIDHVDESRIPGLVSATKRAGTWIVPTQTLFESTVGPLAPDTLAAWPEMKYATAEQIAQWSDWKRKFTAQPTSTEASRARFLDVRRRLIKALHDGGVGMLLGADAPQMWNVPGFSTQRELQAMVRAGLTPFQALSSGTRNVAAFLGTSATTGTVEAGKRADLVLVTGNPLVDVTNASRIDGVVLGGRWLPREEIDRRLAALVAPR